MKKEYSFKFDKDNKLEDFKLFINKNNCRYVTVDLSCLETFEALKFATLASVYHFQKYPSGKLSFKNGIVDLNSLISDFSLNNIEFV